MIQFQERKKIRRILYSKTAIGALVLLTVLVARGAWELHEKAAIARADRAEAERSLSLLKERAAGLEASLADLKSPHGVEAEVRQKFTVARPGEEVVVVVDENAKKSENGEASKGGGFWARIAEFFRGE
ncbi:MAG: hypothetical protein UY07_C0022G0014 [Parcubacteria group bacterium GW2011_GWA1_47_8]|nr:MAG: hypothetical protein UY07_C0022G0014 [Parcubacteria group bacterium GW2011_GWA1_47_8]KKW07871.1 MAG: hypothetical protein UY42_C0004G0013 [Parcubacteria group bacterium GW2011_GWA2_49_16]